MERARCSLLLSGLLLLLLLPALLQPAAARAVCPSGRRIAPCTCKHKTKGELRRGCLNGPAAGVPAILR